MFKTKKEALAAGLKPSDEWSRQNSRRIPRHGEAGIVVKGTEFFRIDQTERLLSRAEARKECLSLMKDASPEATYKGNVGRAITWYVYRESAFKPFTKKSDLPPRTIDLLQATFVVNRTTKRFRDAARSHYQSRQFGFATHKKKSKEELYDLKDAGIMCAYNIGRLQFDGIQNGWAVYRGEGFCFHASFHPKTAPISESTISTDGPLFVDSKPKESKEHRLKDAVFTLTQLTREEINRSSFRRIKIEPSSPSIP